MEEDNEIRRRKFRETHENLKQNIKLYNIAKKGSINEIIKQQEIMESKNLIVDWVYPMRGAIDGSHHMLVVFLLKKNTDLQLFVQLSVNKGNYEIIETILKECELTKTTIDFVRPMMQVGCKGDIQILKLLMNYGASDIYFTFQNAARCNHLKMLEYLISLGVTKQILNNAMGHAVCEGHLEVINFLLLNGADEFKEKESTDIVEFDYQTEAVNYVISKLGLKV